MRRIVIPLLAVLLGAATTFGVAFAALVWADRATTSMSSVIVRNGTEAWLVRQHWAFGLQWVNCERVTPALVNETPAMIDIPQWAIPPERAWPLEGNPRAATLAVGWPAPIMARQWTTSSLNQIFPLQFDLDDGHDSLRRAAARFRESDPTVPITLLPRGLIVNFGLFALAWAAMIWLASTVVAALLHRQERNQPAHQQQ